MTIERVSRPVRWTVVSIALAAVTGCANLAPVRTFADETKKLTAAFAPMPAATVASCVDKEQRKDFIAPAGTFSLEEARKAAKALCKPIEDANVAVDGVAAVLEQYADTLAALSDEKLPGYKDELGGLGTSLTSLKSAGQPLLSADQAGAVVSLGQFLGSLATQRIALKEVKALLDQGMGFDAAADALSAYATRIYEPYIQRNINDIDTALRDHLPKLAETQGLAARSQMIALTDERERLEASKGAVKSLAAATDRMKKARVELRARIDRPDDAELWKQLSDFAKEVRNLRRQVREAF